MPCPLSTTLLFVTKWGWGGASALAQLSVLLSQKKAVGPPHCWVVLSGLRSCCKGMGWT